MHIIFERKWKPELSSLSMFSECISGNEWGQPNATNCVGQSIPLAGSSYPEGSTPAEKILENSRNHVETSLFAQYHNPFTA